jgi:hypothetical protein
LRTKSRKRCGIATPPKEHESGTFCLGTGIGRKGPAEFADAALRSGFGV